MKDCILHIVATISAARIVKRVGLGVGGWGGILSSKTYSYIET